MGVDVKGKIVVMLRRLPRWSNDKSPFGGDKRNEYASLEKKVALDNISPMELQEVSPLFGNDVHAVFDPRHSLSIRTAIGSPSPQNVKMQIEQWWERLKKTGY